MDFFLFKRQEIVFSRNDVYKENKLNFRKVAFQTSWCPVNGNGVHKLIGSELQRIATGKTLQLEIGYVRDQVWNEARLSGDSCLEQIYTVAQKEGLNVHAALRIHNFGFMHDGNNSQYRMMQAITKKTPIGPPNGIKPFTFEWKGMFFSSAGGMYDWNGNHHDFDGELEIIMTLTPAAECGCLSSLKLKDLTEVNRKILTDRIGSDLSIVPTTGKPVLCHRAFLIAHSPAFDNLVKGTFADPKSNFLKMPELSEMSANALIEYMYLGDTTKPEENSIVAVELFTAAQNYEVKGLKESMRKLLGSKPDAWFKVEMLLKFYNLVKTAPQENDLKAKAVRLIKANYKAVRQSESYKQLFKDDPNSAMELMDFLFDS